MRYLWTILSMIIVLIGLLIATHFVEKKRKHKDESDNIEVVDNDK